MSIVKNEAKYKNGLLRAIREQLEHRAHWLYLLCDEAGKRGLDWKEFGYPAIRRCGLSQGANLVKKGQSTPISRSPLGKNPMPGHLSELHPVNEVNTKGK